MRIRTLPFVLLALALGCGDDDSEPTVDGGATDGSTPVADGSTPGTDGSTPDEDGGSGGTDGGTSPGSDACAERTAAIVAATGATIEVSPAGDGQVMVDGSTMSLRSVIQSAPEGSTILLADGTYTLPAAGGGYTGLYFTKPDVTLRGASGDASAVVIDSAYRLHGGGSASITIAAPRVTIANLTVQRSVFHLIHFWADGDAAVIHDVRLVDGGQQFMKASPGDSAHVDDVEVGCSSFEMTADGRDNVWGYGSQTGNTTCYTGGIDTHGSRDWHVHDSHFEGIYCAQGGTPRPAHGQAADQRGGMTYTGGLSEHAIHMWDSEEGSGGHLIERNTIVDCARGIGLGFRTEVYDVTIRNNTVSSRFPGGGGHDIAISVERGHDCDIDNNTVFMSDPDHYTNAIEYRWASTSGLRIRNNLVNGLIRARNEATANLAGNMTDATAGLFVDAAAGDLHLADCGSAPVGAGEMIGAVEDDLDGTARGASNDVGADQCE
ncbi:MAG: hypothetical protein CMN30_21010 [Sandaracinus sp.]|nr:hypothetical protein [Sandaracinus sp.]